MRYIEIPKFLSNFYNVMYNLEMMTSMKVCTLYVIWKLTLHSGGQII